MPFVLGAESYWKHPKMIKGSIALDKIEAVEFAVRLRNQSIVALPVDAKVQRLLIESLIELDEKIAHGGLTWELYNLSEEYSKERLLYCSLNDDLVSGFKAVRTFGSMPTARPLREIVSEIQSYIVVFTDEQKRRLIGVKRATRFKGLVGERSRLVQIFDNTLTLVESEVFRLERDFDVLITEDDILILNVRAFEILANLQKIVAAAAASRLDKIESQISFLDLSGLKGNIGKHPRSARIATSVSKRDDLGKIQMEQLKLVVEAQKIKLLSSPDGRLRPKQVDQHKFLEILDDRRYISKLTGVDEPFIARSRVKATD